MNNLKTMNGIIQDRPIWLKQRVSPQETIEMQDFLKERNIETVCENALCPNRGECYRRKTAAFMILGSVCSRNCRFCAVKKGKPEIVDSSEPLRISRAIKDLEIRHAVITSVTRDDLPDGGASQFNKVIKEIKKLNPKTIIEVLTPDFQGFYSSVKTVIEAGPDVFNHNLETVPRLYPKVRPVADYERSLEVLREAKEISSKIITKSGLMLGMGERQDEVEKTMDDLRKIGCDFLTLGQYLAPTKNHYPIKEFVRQDVFEKYKEIAISKRFKYVVSGPWVRSSYYADRQFISDFRFRIYNLK